MPDISPGISRGGLFDQTHLREAFMQIRRWTIGGSCTRKCLWRVVQPGALLCASACAHVDTGAGFNPRTCGFSPFDQTQLRQFVGQVRRWTVRGSCTGEGLRRVVQSAPLLSIAHRRAPSASIRKMSSLSALMAFAPSEFSP